MCGFGQIRSRSLGLLGQRRGGYSAFSASLDAVARLVLARVFAAGRVRGRRGGALFYVAGLGPFLEDDGEGRRGVSHCGCGGGVRSACGVVLQE